VNSVGFLVAMMQSFSIQSSFYIGRPFVESFFDRKVMLVSGFTSISIIMIIALEIIPPLNKFFDFSPFPTKKLKV
jgi:hypothetical protein